MISVKPAHRIRRDSRASNIVKEGDLLLFRSYIPGKDINIQPTAGSGT